MKKEIVEKEVSKKAETNPLEDKGCHYLTFRENYHGPHAPAKFIRAGVAFCSNRCARKFGLKNPKLDSASTKLYTFTTMTQGSNYLAMRKASVQVKHEEKPLTIPGIKSPIQHGLVCNTMQGFGRERK